MEYFFTASQEIERDAHVSIEMKNIIGASQDIEREDGALLEHDPVVIAIRGMLESLPPLSSDCCIYRVPERLRKVNEEAYTPRVISIGPFHRKNKRLQAMEEHKLRYLKNFLNRTGQGLEDFVKHVRNWEERARDFYAETIELSRDEFVKMILVDGSFIVELLLKYHFSQSNDKSDLIFDESDLIFRNSWMIGDVRQDMTLLENQLPFFVLERFFNLVAIKTGNLSFSGGLSLLKLTHKYFNHSLKIDKLPDTISSPQILHFVDFIRSCLSSVPREWYEGNERYECPPSVTKLHEAGIKFKMVTNCSLLGIKFTDGVLEIPHLVIDDMTETLFRNLIAFEKCHCLRNNIIIHYMTLLDDLINTSKDVDLLIQYGVITSRLGSSEGVSTLLNNIGKEFLIPPNFYFSGLCKDLNAYCKTPWHRWKATLKRDYFNTPWKVVSIIAAVVLLILTFIQTLCSVISV